MPANTEHATGPGPVPGTGGMPVPDAGAYWAELAELAGPDRRPRWQRRAGTAAQRTAAARWQLLAGALEAAPAQAPAPETLPPDHPARVLLAHSTGTGPLAEHAEATATAMPAQPLEALPAHQHTAELLTRRAAGHVRAAMRARLRAHAGHAAGHTEALAQLLEAPEATERHPLESGPELSAWTDWPPPWPPTAEVLALSTSTLTAAPPTPAPAGAAAGAALLMAA